MNRHPRAILKNKPTRLILTRLTLKLTVALVVVASPLAEAKTQHSRTFDLAFFEQQLGFTANKDLRGQLIPLLEDFNRARSHRALAAVNSRQNALVGIVTEAPTQVAASLGALQQCNQARTQRLQALAGSSATAKEAVKPAPQIGDCELLVAGDTYIPTGAQMRQGVSELAPSMVWRIDGGKKPLYLGGSFHLMKPTLYPLPAAFDQALVNSERLALESNLLLAGEPERQQVTAQQSAIEPKKFVRTQTRKQRSALRKFARTEGHDLKQLEAAQPVTTALGLAVLGYYSLGFLPNAGLEMQYAQQAIQLGKPILEIEPHGEVLGRLVNFPLTDQHEMLEDTINQLQDPQYRETLFDLFDAWLKGNDAQLLALADTSSPAYSQGSKRITEYIINERNQSMLAKIKQYLLEDSTTFAMVGALHLVGDKGLIALLTQAGYTPVRLANNGEVYRAP